MTKDKCETRLNLNPIIVDPQYKGLSDGDPRIAELSMRLVSVVRQSQLFDDAVVKNLTNAAASKRFTDVQKAIETLYDYADCHDIWLGTAGDKPADKILPN